MTTCSCTRHVNAPPDRVFAVAADLRRTSAVISGIKRLEVLGDGPIGRGTRFRETRLMFGREATEEMEIVEFDPPRGYAIGCESCGCRYRSEFRFRPADGGTDMEMTFNAVPLTFAARVMGFFMKRMMMKACM